MIALCVMATRLLNTRCEHATPPATLQLKLLLLHLFTTLLLYRSHAFPAVTKHVSSAFPFACQRC
jgi:hypothetical protein